MDLGIYLPAEVLIWSGLLLDEVYFPSYHEIKIKQPVFIIGNPRGGTTFLQRLLAINTDSFISMRTGEFLHGAVKIGNAIGEVKDFLLNVIEETRKNPGAESGLLPRVIILPPIKTWIRVP
ncbi:MAG: hypothetical protein V3R33_09820 [Anaerolineales bacterium]